MPLEQMLTEKDIGILTNLYNFGTMKMNQMLSIYFEGVQEYGRKRIKKLMNRGYIKRVGHLYRITDKGMTEINEINMNKTESRNLVRRVNKENVMFMSELHTQIYKHNWKVTSSRLTKAKYNLNRGCKIEGMITNEYTGEKYMVYILSKEPQANTLLTIKNEISTTLRSIQMNQVIIYSHGPEGEKLFIEDNTTYGAGKLHIYPPQYGIKVLKKTARPEWLEELSKKLLGDNPVTATNELHADLIMNIRGQEYYVTEMITCDLVKSYHLLRYGRDAAELDGRRVILITPESMKDKLKELINEKTYPHVTLATFTDTWLTN